MTTCNSNVEDSSTCKSNCEGVGRPSLQDIVNRCLWEPLEEGYSGWCSSAVDRDFGKERQSPRTTTSECDHPSLPAGSVDIVAQDMERRCEVVENLVNEHNGHIMKLMEAAQEVGGEDIGDCSQGVVENNDWAQRDE